MNFKPLYSLVFIAGFGLFGCSGEDAPKAEIPAVPAEETPVTAKKADVGSVPLRSRGEIIFKKCRTCHTLKEGERHKVGPNLYAVMDAEAAKKEGFNYSKVMQASGIVWTDENLDGYLERPNKFMPGNQMTFIGLRKPEDRAAVIAYLRRETAVQ